MSIEHKKGEEKTKERKDREMCRKISKYINIVLFFLFPCRKYKSRSSVIY